MVGRLGWTAAAAAGAWVTRGVHRTVQGMRADQARVQAIASGPVDVDGLRAVVAEVVTGLPPGAVQVRETLVAGRPYPGLSEHPELRLTPRAAGAIQVLLMWWADDGSVAVFLDDGPPIELTAPVNVNSGPPERPFLDELRDVLLDAAHGRADRGVHPVSGDVWTVRWSDAAGGSRPSTGHRWTPATPWT